MRSYGGRCHTQIVTGAPGSDDQLARRCADGDEEAFAEIYRRHHQGLYRYCLSILRHPEDARDALQAAMEKALRAMPSQRVAGGLRPWLYRIAHNEAISLASRRSRQSEDATLAPASNGNGEATGDRLEQLLADLSTLPLQQRSAVVLRELSGLGTEEIGTALDISPSAAKQSIYEARLALRHIGEGRDMNCQKVQRKISDGDGRELRGRRVKAHLGDCAVCRSFRESIAGRRSDLSLLFPPLGAAAAAKTLASVTGGAASRASDASAASAGSAASQGPATAGSASRASRHRRQAGLAGLLALLGAGAAIGLWPHDDSPQKSGAPAGADPKAPRAAATPRDSASARRTPPQGGRRSQGARPQSQSQSQAPPTGSGVAGYSPLELTALQALGANGNGNDDGNGNGSGPAAGGGAAGSGSSSASDQADNGNGLAFTGLDLGLLALAGAGLLLAGILTRRLARPAA